MGWGLSLPIKEEAGEKTRSGAPPSHPPQVTYRLHFVFDELHNIMFHDGILLESIKSIERSI